MGAKIPRLGYLAPTLIYAVKTIKHHKLEDYCCPMFRKAVFICFRHFPPTLWLGIGGGYPTQIYTVMTIKTSKTGRTVVKCSERNSHPDNRDGNSSTSLRCFYSLTVFIWVGAKIPRLGYFGPHPLFRAKKWE